PPRWSWRGWPHAVERKSPASITSTGVTSGWRPSWRTSARASSGERERAAHAGASQGPSARRRAGPPARYRRGRHRRRFPPADLHRPAARTPPALPQAGRRSRLRDVWRRRPRDRRQGHPAGAGAGRLRTARSRLRSLPARRRRAAGVVGARRSIQVVVGPRRHEVRPDDGAVLLRARHPGGDRASGRLDRAGAAGRAGRAHRRSRPDGGDAEGQRPRRGRGDRALDGTVDRQPGLHEDGVLRNHELYRSIGKPNAAAGTSNRPPADRTDLTDPVTMIRTLDARELGADEVVRRLARPPAAVDPLIQRYHAAALPKSWRITDEHGSVLGQEIRPLDRVGVYIPGGRASYPSTVLMTAVPARVAGVRDIVLVTPPGRDGRVDPTVLAAA